MEWLLFLFMLELGSTESADFELNPTIYVVAEPEIVLLENFHFVGHLKAEFGQDKTYYLIEDGLTAGFDIYADIGIFKFGYRYQGNYIDILNGGEVEKTIYFRIEYRGE